jgi:phage baseplate assembly protein W
MWDLAIADNGDLIISGHHDLLGRSGIDLLEQRMRLRLMVHRGSWVLDEPGTFGSNLRRLIGMSPQNAAQSAPALVREALREIDEINVDSVFVSPTETDLTIIVHYHIKETGGGSAASPDELELSISLPVAASGLGSGE